MLVGFAAVFTEADDSGFSNDRCEREALKTIAATSDTIVPLVQACSILDWHPITEPVKSDLNTELLLHRRIIDRKKLYYKL